MNAASLFVFFRFTSCQACSQDFFFRGEGGQTPGLIVRKEVFHSELCDDATDEPSEVCELADEEPQQGCRSNSDF